MCWVASHRDSTLEVQVWVGTRTGPIQSSITVHKTLKGIENEVKCRDESEDILKYCSLSMFGGDVFVVNKKHFRLTSASCCVILYTSGGKQKIRNITS